MSTHSFLDPVIINRLIHLTLESRKSMIGSVSGRHRSPMRGSSLEFAQYRKYEIGDDMRRLDWRVWGRTDRAYVKEFEADTNLRICFVVDCSGSMNYNGPQSGVTKLQMAKRIAGSLAWVAARQGDAVGLASAGAISQSASTPKKSQSDIPARRGARHLRAVLDRLESMNADGDGHLPQHLHQTAEKLPRRGLVVVVSDLFTDLEALKRSLRHLRHRKHDIVIFHLLDSTEVDFQFDQPMRFIDLEGGLPVLSDPILTGDNYRNVVQDYLQSLNALVQSTAVDYRRLDLRSDLADELAKFLTERYSRRSRSRR